MDSSANGICRKVLEMDSQNKEVEIILENLRRATEKNKGSFNRNREVQSYIGKENLKGKR